MEQDKTFTFMQMAMQYLPEAKEKLDASGVELSLEVMQPFMDLLIKVMNDAYQLGLEEAKQELPE